MTKYPDPGPVKGAGSYIIEEIAPGFEEEEAARRMKEEAARRMKEEAARRLKSPVFDKEEDHPAPTKKQQDKTTDKKQNNFRTRPVNSR